jgi:hypothetical protein
MSGSEDPYPEIAQILIASVRAAGIAAWSKIVLEAKVEPTWSEFQAIVAPSGHGTSSLLLVGSSRLPALFERVHRITESLGESRWRSARFSLRKNGEFEVDFTY